MPAKACCPAAEKMQSWQGNHHRHKHLARTLMEQKYCTEVPPGGRLVVGTYSKSQLLLLYINYYIYLSGYRYV